MRGISHIAIGVRDMDKSLPFYRDVVGLRVVADEVERLGGMRGVTDHERRAARLVWDNGLWATYVVLSQSPGTASGTPSKLDQIGIHHFSFYVDDLRDRFERVKNSGAKVVLAPTEIERRHLWRSRRRQGVDLHLRGPRRHRAPVRPAD